MSRLSITHQTEAALVAALTEWKNAPPSTLGPCVMLAAQSVDVTATYELPAVVVVASEPKELSFGLNIYELRIKVCIETQVDDEANTPSLDTHHLRVAELHEILDDYTTLAQLVNAPASPATDARAVKNFTLSAITLENETQSQVDRRLVTDLEYYVCASPCG